MKLSFKGTGLFKLAAVCLSVLSLSACGAKHNSQSSVAAANQGLTQKAHAQDPFHCGQVDGQWRCALPKLGQQLPEGTPTTTAFQDDSMIRVEPKLAKLTTGEMARIKEQPSSESPVDAPVVETASNTVRKGPFQCHAVDGVWRCRVMA